MLAVNRSKVTRIIHITEFYNFICVLFVYSYEKQNKKEHGRFGLIVDT